MYPLGSVRFVCPNIRLPVATLFFATYMSRQVVQYMPCDEVRQNLHVKHVGVIYDALCRCTIFKILNFVALT